MDKQKAGMANAGTYARSALAIIAFILFLVLMYGINSGHEFSWEKPVQHYFQSWDTGAAHIFFTIWTELGSRLLITVFTASACIWLAYKHKDFVGLGLTAILVAGADKLNVFVKELVARDRPMVNPAIDATGYSFPSGHAMLSIVTYGIIAYFLTVYMKEKGKKYVIWLMAALIIVVTGISRIVLSAHYPTDVAAGYCLGFVLLIMTVKLYGIITSWVKNIRKKEKK